MALIATAAQLERMCRGYRAAGRLESEPEERSVRRRVLPGGMVKLELVLTPDEAELILRAAERAREVPTEQEERSETPAEAEEPAADVSAEAPWPSMADGVVRVAESYLTALDHDPAGHPVRGNGGERFQVMVHFDRTLMEKLGLAPEGAADDHWAATLEDGTNVSSETFRRAACDCGLLATGRDGENLNIGRRSRTIPPAIRRALMVRDGGGCAFPGCSHTRFLHAHHIKHWLHGGETRLDNLVLICSFHHYLVHEGGWTISRGGDGRFLFQTPDGSPLEPSPQAEPVEDICTWMRQWADEQDLHLGPEVNRPEWDGSRPDYDLAVSVLLEGG